MNINVKVNVKVTNGTFSKKAKNSNLVIFGNKFFKCFQNIFINPLIYSQR